jgi:hypothetical protein
MNKRHIMKPVGNQASAGTRGGNRVWSAVGRQLAARRVELGYSAARVADAVGLTAADYLQHEGGAPVPAFLLGELAELLGRPVPWFFEGLIQEVEGKTEPSHECATYKVATIEHRIQALTDSFRKLDFDGQQHLLAISRALCRAGAESEADFRGQAPGE